MSKKKTTEGFIADAIKVHGNKYDYSLVEYKGATIPVTIICPIHGEFQKRAADHTNGHGCKICARGNVEATKCAFACLGMAQWKDEQFSKFLLWLDDHYVIRRFTDGEPMTYADLIDGFKSMEQQ